MVALTQSNYQTLYLNYFYILVIRVYRNRTYKFGFEDRCFTTKLTSFYYKTTKVFLKNFNLLLKCLKSLLYIVIFFNK